MTEALGLVAFVLVFAAAGYGLLLAIAGLPSLRCAVLSLPFAYVLGLAGLGVLLTLEVIVGVPFGLASILGSAALVAAGGTVIAVRRGRPTQLPPFRGWTLGDALGGAALLAATVVVLEGAFRSSRLQGLFGWDAGSFWVPKAEAIFASGGLDERHFTTLPGPGYPPLVPVVQAASFELLGTAEMPALHLVYWSILAGFALAAGLLLSRFAGPVSGWAAVLLVLTAGEVAGGARTPQGDFLMDAFLAFALLLVLLWVRERQSPFLALSLVFVAAAALTKREALLALACLAVAAGIATARRRRAWPAVAAVGATALAVTVPWRLWAAANSIGGDGPEAGGTGLVDNLDRLGPSISLVARTLVDPAEWSVLFLVAVLGVLASLAVRRREEALLVASFLALSAAGFVWVMWAFPSLPLTQTASVNPIVRLCGAALIPAALCAPLLLQPALDELRPEVVRPLAGRVRVAAVAIVLAAAAAYPAAVLAVDGLPRFPDRGECADELARPAEPFELVYDRRTSLREAEAVRERLVQAGFVGAVVRSDGCGRWKVVNPGVQTLEQARGHIEDARRAGFSPRLEKP